MPRRQRRNCTKISLSKSDAERMAERLRRMGTDDPKAPLGIYRCVKCGRWHVGHNRFADLAEVDD